MRLKAIYATEDEIPEGFRELYTERNGQFELTGIEGIKTNADVERLQGSLTKERNDHKETKGKLAAFTDALGDREIDDIVADLDRIPELEAKGGSGELDETKLNKLVEARVNAQVTPLQRKLDKLQKERDDALGEVDNFRTKDRKRNIDDALRKAAKEAKVADVAVDDILMYGGMFSMDEDGRVVTSEATGSPGLDATTWLQDMQDKRPHWWGPSSGGGALGGQGGGGAGKTNPFSAEGWNMTEQGKLIKENPAKARQMAEAAGTTVGGPRPKPKQ